MTEISFRLEEANLFRQAFEFILRDIANNRFDITGELAKARYEVGLFANHDDKEIPVVIVNTQIDEQNNEKVFKNLNVYYAIKRDENGRRYLDGDVILITK